MNPKRVQGLGMFRAWDFKAVGFAALGALGFQHRVPLRASW